MPARPEDSAKDTKMSADEKSSAANSSPLHEEFFQSLAYTAIQKPCDGISQAINYFGGNVADRTFIAAPTAAEVGSSHWIAQQAGAGIATLGEVMLLHRGMRLAGASLGAQTASSLAITESAATGRVTAASLATSGALYEGLVTKSGDNFLGDRLTNAAVAGSSMFLMGKAQLGLQNLSGVRSLAAQMSEGISGTLGRQMLNGASGFLAGAAGGAFGAETSSLLKHGKFASTSELAEKTFSTAFMGGVFATVTKPAIENVRSVQRAGALPSVHLEAPPVRTISENVKVDHGPDLSLLAPRPSAIEAVPAASGLIARLKLQTGDSTAKGTPVGSVALEPMPIETVKPPAVEFAQKLTDQHTP